MNNRKIEAPEVTLPKGGGAIKGLGETFQPNLFSGTAALTIPVYTSPSRDFSPEISLSYSSATGNGIFGIGFDVDRSSIYRLTDKGIPEYEATDTFVFSGVGQLTPELEVQGEGRGERYERDERGLVWLVRAYLPRIEEALARIEQLINSETGASYWRVVNSDNVTNIFGRSEGARIANPADPLQVFEWLIEESFDSKGNKIIYTYKQEDNANVLREIYEAGRSSTAKRYQHSIKYGNYKGEGGGEAFACEIIFDYGEYDLDNLQQQGSDPHRPARPWQARADSFSTYRSGFEIRTHRLCRGILMFHHFSAPLGETPCLVRATRFSYEQTPSFSFLRSATSYGYRRKPDGSYDVESLPPLEYLYSKFEPQLSAVFHPLHFGEGETIPGYLNDTAYLPVDLNGEGLPGFLSTDRMATFYYGPLGKGAYAPAVTLPSFPMTPDASQPSLALSDLDSDGHLELVVTARPVIGFYSQEADGSWETFRPFTEFPASLMGAAGEAVDLNGDGKVDLLQVEQDDLVFYLSEGLTGYNASQRVSRPAGFPLKVGTAQEVVTFADMFGDGLSHRVRISDGRVEVWPNLGYGRFGPKVLLGGAPRFASNTSALRIYFADLDGSGTSDLVFAYYDRVEVYLNRSGNSFAAPFTIRLPVSLTEIDQLSFVDILGHGTTALVISKMTPEVRHWYYDFCEEQREGHTPAAKQSSKPYLLTKFTNNMGSSTEIRYANSTRFYLEDKEAGNPWVTRLPFPVQVVEKIVTTDLVSGASLTRRFRYHDGYYDATEKEFRGFGFVESWDAEAFGAFPQGDGSAAPSTLQLKPDLYVPPVYRKTWHHTGAYFEAGAISGHYRHQYFSGDAQAHELPDSCFDPAITLAGPETVAQAHAALAGFVLRTEVYAEGQATGQPPVPYTVEETNYFVQLLQPAEGGKYASFYVRERENINYDYERDATDPRIEHTFLLALTLFDLDAGPTYLEQTCTVYYGRRPPISPEVYVYPEQLELKATAELQRYTNVREGFRLIGVPYEQLTFEVGGLDLKGDGYFTFEAVKAQVDVALRHRIPYGVDFTPGAPEARALAWQQVYFWDQGQNNELPLGQISERALLHHRQDASFSGEWARMIYADKVDEALLERAGYRKGGDHWWNKGLTQHYYTALQPERFYLPSRIENTNEGAGPKTRTTFEYDQPYFQAPVVVSEYFAETSALVTALELDYHTLAPWQMTDPNRVIRQVLYNPMGMVLATSIFKEAQGGQPRQGDGDLRDYHVRPGATFDAVLADKAYYLQEASSFFFYDLRAWERAGASEPRQPASYISLSRQSHVSDLPPGRESVIETHIGYSDGLGRLAQEKGEAEAGEAILLDGSGRLRRDAAGRPLLAVAERRWQVSGLTVYNNKGEPTERYMPYYSNTPYYETQWEVIDERLVPPPTTFRFDPLLRPVRIDTPKGFFSKTEFDAWEQKQYDENDTVKDSQYYREFFEHYPLNPTPEQRDEKEALEKAAKCYDTPGIIVLDNLRHPIRSIENNLADVPRDAFHALVEGTLVTSLELWDDLVANGYLRPASEPGGDPSARVTPKFQPYRAGFNLHVSPKYQQFARPLTEYLLQNCLTTFLKPDIEGRLLLSIDPRLYYANVTSRSGLYNFRYSYPMDGQEASRVDSVDAGRLWLLPDIYDNLLESWDSRGHRVIRTYDPLQRLLTVEVKDGEGVRRQTEAVTYGEGQPDAAGRNLCGEVYQYKDEAGVLLNARYGIQGQVEHTTRQLRREYRSEVDWREDVRLEDKIYSTSYRYDALQRITSEITDDGSDYQPGYFVSGRLQSIRVTYADGTVQPFITDIRYTADDQRLKISFGNNSTQFFDYERTTERLVKIYSTRPGQNKNGRSREGAVQHVTCTYDPVGNVTLTRDKTQETVFCYNQQVEAKGDYTYNPLYRLIKATGRQHPGIQADTHTNGFKQSIYAPLCPPDINDAVKLERYTEHYHYDWAGNLITTRHLAVSGSFTRTSPVSDSSNRLRDVEYDGNGNPLHLSLKNKVGLTWDYRNNLVRTTLVKREGTFDDCDYVIYDHRGQRIRKVVERLRNGDVLEVEDHVYLGSYERKLLKREVGTQTTTLLDRQTLRVLDEGLTLALMHHWVIDEGRREAKRGAGQRQVRYQLCDHLRSVSLELDGSDGAIISYEEYFPYGGTSVIAGNNQVEVQLKDYRYSGEECDDSTGLYYYGARYYAQWMGRWLTPDPAGTVDGLNLYAFVLGNPVTSVDVGGFVTCGLCGKAGHNKGNTKFHPKGGRGPRVVLSSKTVLNKHKRKNHDPKLKKLQGKNVVKVFTKKSKHGGTNVYIYLNQKALRGKYNTNTSDYIEDELEDKYAGANQLISSGLEKATIGSTIHEGTSSQQFAKAQWDAKYKSRTNIPKNPSGKTVDIRGIAELLSPSPAGLVDHHGNPLKKDVDELVSRDYGGSGSHANGQITPKNTGQNQWFMNNWANSLAGSADTAVLADAKKRNHNQTDVREFKLRRVSSFTSI